MKKYVLVRLDFPSSMTERQVDNELQEMDYSFKYSHDDSIIQSEIIETDYDLNRFEP